MYSSVQCTMYNVHYIVHSALYSVVCTSCLENRFCFKSC